ncbi:MAG: hypothetical protein HYY84_04090, partial [Deltaproteobacteria bacterium]|nr:hypothetical protein [Deltaproteobacteria bacterium]
MKTMKVLGLTAFLGFLGGRPAEAWDCGLSESAKNQVRQYCACDQIADDCDKLVTLRNNIRNGCNGLTNQMWRYTALTSAGIAMAKTVSSKVKECVSYEKQGQWLSAYNALSAARAAWRPNTTDFKEVSQQTGSGQTGGGTYARTGNAAKDLANMKALCNAQTTALGALSTRASGMDLSTDHRRDFDAAVGVAKANIQKCLSNQVAALTDFVNNAVNSVNEAKNVLDHWKGKKDAEAATEALIKGLIAGNNALRDSLGRMWSAIADLQDKGKRCLNDPVNMYRENVATVCPNPSKQDFTSLTAQQKCLLGEVREAGQVTDDLQKRIAADWSCKAYAGVDWAVGKFCGEFPAICSVIRDGRACMQRIAGLGQAEIDAVKRAWAAVRGVGQIVVNGWSLDAVTALGKAALTNTTEILRAAGSAIAECTKWAARSAGTLVVATANWVGETLCSIDPGPMVCPIIKGVAECVSSAKTAGVKIASSAWSRM